MKLRRTLLDIPTVDIEPSDPAGSWRRAQVQDCPPDVAVVLEGDENVLERYEVEVAFHPDWVAIHEIKLVKGTWTPSGEVRFRRQSAIQDGERELSLASQAPETSPPPARVRARAGMDSHRRRVHELLRVSLELADELARVRRSRPAIRQPPRRWICSYRDGACTRRVRGGVDGRRSTLPKLMRVRRPQTRHGPRADLRRASTTRATGEPTAGILARSTRCQPSHHRGDEETGPQGGRGSPCGRGSCQLPSLVTL